MLNITNIPPPRVTLVDERTGMISREWYRFFFNLFTLTGGGSNNITLEDLQIAPTASDQSGNFESVYNQAQLAALVNSYSQQVQNVLDQISTQPPSIPIVVSTNYQTPPTSIFVGASPFLYTNITNGNVDVLISGSGVSALDFSRNSTTFYDTGSYYGMFSLSPADMLRVTYSSTPVMTLIQR